MWPQYTTLPTDTPPVPEGFDWDLWLGPEAARPYHPNYTHMVFRGWYDFGGGSMADMGHYSLWTVFKALELGSPTSVEPMLSHTCEFKDNVATKVKNDFSFPTASVVRFKYPARGKRPAVDLIWYEGGMRPPTPPELEEDNKELPAEGMMFVGAEGKILAGFHVENPRLIPERRMRGHPVRKRLPGGNPRRARFRRACANGWRPPEADAQSPGSFLNAGPISEAVNLYAVALRTGRKLLYDARTGRSPMFRKRTSICPASTERAGIRNPSLRGGWTGIQRIRSVLEIEIAQRIDADENFFTEAPWALPRRRWSSKPTRWECPSGVKPFRSGSRSERISRALCGRLPAGDFG